MAIQLYTIIYNTIPCIVQYILVAYLFYEQQFVLNTLPLSCPSPLSLPTGNY